MTPDAATQLAVVLLAATTLASVAGWAPYGRTIWPPIAVLAMAATAVAAAVPETLDTDDRALSTLVVALAGAVAVLGGGPVVTWVFAFVDRDQPEAQSIGRPGILRGGAWIGALERLAVFAGLAAGFPEGVAVVLALKGVGRFPDLRSDDGGAAKGTATERFIIGTFTSVLWAAGAAGVVALTLR
jgi:hypothetical protein